MTKAKSKISDELSATFWEHLDVLRSVIIRVLMITVASALVAFGFKDFLFNIVLAPHSSDFITFRWLGGEPFCVQLMNVDLTEQFMMHMKTAIFVGLLVAAPYILYAVFQFVSPALYDKERKYATVIVSSGYLMFMLGTALNYFLIFPLTVRFLGTYNVSPDVTNMLSVRSYIDTLLTMSLLLGVIFELPVVCYILARLGLITARFMSEYRRHAVVIILIVAAIITPTTDIFTLLVVSLPIWILYEMSILLVRLTRKKKDAEETVDDAVDTDHDSDLPAASDPASDETDHSNDSTESAETTASNESEEREASDEQKESEEKTDLPQDKQEESVADDMPAWERQALDWETQRLQQWGYNDKP